MARFGELSTCYTGKNATDEILNISTMVRPSLKMMIMASVVIQTQIWQKDPKLKYLTSLAHILSMIDRLLDFSHHLKTWSLNASTISTELHRSAAAYFNFNVEFQMNCK